MNCKRYRFDEVTVNFDRKRVPLSSKQRAELQGCYRYYGAQGVIDYVDDYIFDGTYLLIAEDGENLKSQKQNIAQIAKGKFWVNNHAHIVQTNELCDLRYLYYIINSMDLSGYITGSAQPKLSQANLNAVMLELPAIEEQKRIVSILGALDDKIELNNKINDNLEQQTQALYQKYFPETDNAGKLADLCDFSKDKIAVSELNVKNYFSTENMLPDKKGTTEAANLPAVEQTTACHIGNVLVSNIRPYFKKILYCHCEGGCSTDVLCFVPKILELSAYLYCTLYADKFFDFMVAGSKGTKMPRGDKKQIMTYSVCLPSENELKNFNAAVLPMFQLIESNRRENARLSLLRDTLLPKLMAGEI